MKRFLTFSMLVAIVILVAACAAPAAPPPAQAPAATQAPGSTEVAPTPQPAVATEAAPAPTAAGQAGLDQYGERYDADAAVMQKAVGTTEGIPDIAKAAFYRAGQPVSEEMQALALKCFNENTCDTGTGGALTVALTDGFGENFWRQMTKMEFILQALTYPEIGKIIYTTANSDTQKSIADVRSLVAQDVDIIINFPDAGDAILPAVRDATENDTVFITHSYGKIGEPGTDYATFVAEDVCKLGQLFAETLNEEVGTGKVAFLGGTPGNPLSAYWQSCEEPLLGENLELVGKADTSWTQQGTLEAVSGLISSNPDIKGYSYEAADSFLGGVRAYQAADLPLDVVLTLRTDENSLFCEMNKINNPNFKAFFGSGGNYQSRIALTAAMMKLKGYELPAEGIIIPTVMRQATADTCQPDLPQQASLSSLIPVPIFEKMGQ